MFSISRTFLDLNDIENEINADKEHIWPAAYQLWCN